MKRIVALCLMIGLIVGSVPVLAQGVRPLYGPSTLDQQPVSFKNPFVYVGADGNVYMSDEASGAGSPITGDSTGGPTNAFPFFKHSLSYDQFAWSSDGKMLAFTERTQNAIYVVADGKAPVQVAKGVDTGLPPAFSPDDKEIGYAVKTSQQTGADKSGLILQMQAVPALGGNPRALGSLEGTPWVCGADMGFDAGDAAFLNEIGLIGFGPLTFQWTKIGYLHTMGCNGMGVAFSNGNTDAWKNPALINAVLSPDKTQVLAVQIDPSDPTSTAKKLVIVDLATGNVTPLDTQPNVDRGAWSSDGKTIIYSTLTSVRKVSGDKSKAVGTQLFGDQWPLQDVPENGIIVYTMPVGGGQSSQIFKETGRGIGFISSAFDKPNVLFSFITSFAKMIDSINAGDSVDKVLSLAPHSEIRSQPLDSNGFPVTVANGGQPSYSPAASFSIIPAQVSTGAATPTLVLPTLFVGASPTPPPPQAQPTITVAPTNTPSIVLSVGGNCPGVLPTRLKIGIQGQVLPGRANRFRAVPEGDIIGLIPENAIFDVLDGPVCTSDNVTWWKVKYNSQIGYTAEAQGNTYFVQPYNPSATTAPTSDGTFGIVGVTAKVSPTSSTTCPMTFNFSGQIVVNKPGTVTYRWERSDGTNGLTQTVNFGPGVTTVDLTDTWTLSGATIGWERIHVLTPNDISSNQAGFSLTCGGGGASVTKVTASVSSPGGPSCPIEYDFTGTITTNGATSVSYRWERSDGGVATTQTINFAAAGSQNVTYSWKVGSGHGTTFNGWAKVHVFTPNDISSNQANFVLTCP